MGPFDRKFDWVTKDFITEKDVIKKDFIKFKKELKKDFIKKVDILKKPFIKELKEVKKPLIVVKKFKFTDLVKFVNLLKELPIGDKGCEWKGTFQPYGGWYNDSKCVCTREGHVCRGEKPKWKGNTCFVNGKQYSHGQWYNNGHCVCLSGKEICQRVG